MNEQSAGRSMNGEEDRVAGTDVCYHPSDDGFPGIAINRFNATFVKIGKQALVGERRIGLFNLICRWRKQNVAGPCEGQW